MYVLEDVSEVLYNYNVFRSLGYNDTPPTLDGKGDCGSSTFVIVDNFEIVGGQYLHGEFMNVKTKEECLAKCNRIGGEGCAAYKFNSNYCCDEEHGSKANCQVFTEKAIYNMPEEYGGGDTGPWLQCVIRED